MQILQPVEFCSSTENPVTDSSWHTSNLTMLSAWKPSKLLFECYIAIHQDCMCIRHLAVPPSLSVMTDHVIPVLNVCHEASGWPNKRTWEQIFGIWTILLEFGLMTCYCSLSVAGDADPSQKWPNGCQLRNQSYLFVLPETIYLLYIIVLLHLSYPLSLYFFSQLSLIPKIILLVIPYPYIFLVSYPLSLKLFC